MNEILWRPSAERVAAARITRFAAERGFEGADAVDQLWRWSVAEPAAFWQAVWDLGRVRASRPADAVLEGPSAMPGARWFAGARLLARKLLVALWRLVTRGEVPAGLVLRSTA